MSMFKLKEISGHAAGIYAAEYQEDFIYTASADRYIARWNYLEGTQDAFAIRFEQPVYSIKLFLNNTYLAAGLGNGDLHFFDLKSRSEVNFYQQHRAAIFSSIEDSSRNFLIFSDAAGNLSVWDTLSRKLVIYLPFDCGKIRRMTIAPNTSHLYLACQDGYVRVIDLDTFNLIHSFYAHAGGTTAICMSEDGTFLYTGGKDAFIRKWDVKNEVLIKEIPAHNFVVYDISLLHTNLLLTASRDKTIKIFSEELDFMERLDVKKGGHRHSVNGIGRIDASTFFSFSDDKRLIVWSNSIQ